MMGVITISLVLIGIISLLRDSRYLYKRFVKSRPKLIQMNEWKKFQENWEKARNDFA